MFLQKETYQGNPNVKRDGVLQEWTPELIEEYKKCLKSPSYFASEYVKNNPPMSCGIEGFPIQTPKLLIRKKIMLAPEA